MQGTAVDASVLGRFNSRAAFHEGFGCVRLRKGEQADHVQVRISNTGSWQAPPPAPGNAPIRGGLGPASRPRQV